MIRIKNARFNPRLICWYSPQHQDGVYVLAIQCMGCEVQLITYKDKEERDQDVKRIDEAVNK